MKHLMGLMKHLTDNRRTLVAEKSYWSK